MRILRPADYRRMPWRNGGGTTTEIAIAPEGGPAPGERFLHRVSIAEVVSDGPFSRFAGYDRHILVLEGAGMTLDCGAHGSIALTRLAPRSFSGDWEVTGKLTAGPVRDFNVIVDRARAQATLSVRAFSAPERFELAAGDTGLLHVLSGETEPGACWSNPPVAALGLFAQRFVAPPLNTDGYSRSSLLELRENPGARLGPGYPNRLLAAAGDSLLAETSFVLAPAPGSDVTVAWARITPTTT